MDRFRDEPILDVIARVKAGQAHPGDVEALTELRSSVDESQHASLAAMIDDALSETDWITEAEKAGAVPTMRPPTADGFGGVPPNMGPMTNGQFDYLPTAQQEKQDRQDAAARLFELQQQTLPPGTPPMPGGSPFDAVGAMQAAQGPPGSLGALGSAAPPPPVERDPHTNWLEEKNRQGGILGGAPTGDWASGLGNLLGGLIGPAPPSSGKGTGTVRIGTPDPIWRPFSDVGDPAAAAAAGDALPTAGSAATANASPFALPGQEGAPDYGEDPTLPPPDRGGKHRNNVTRGTDWRAERDARRAARGDMGDTLGLPEDSAFAGVSTDMMHELLYQPDLMAQMIAQKMGGGPMTASLVAPQVQSALQLVNAGALGGGPRGSGLGPELSDTDQLQMIEAFVRQGASQTGVQVDPYKAYRGSMKRALDTDVGALQRGADERGGRTAQLNQQIQTTQDALLSGSSGMGPGAEEKLRARLDKAASDWLLEVMKLPPGEARTYPQYLKDVKAQKWFR